MDLIGGLLSTACLGLALAGLLHLLIEIGVFLWADVWLSPIEMVAAEYPRIHAVPWIAHPEHFLGVHSILMSPYFGLVAVPVGGLLFYVFLYLAGYASYYELRSMHTDTEEAEEAERLRRLRETADR